MIKSVFSFNPQCHPGKGGVGKENQGTNQCIREGYVLGTNLLQGETTLTALSSSFESFSLAPQLKSEKCLTVSRLFAPRRHLLFLFRAESGERWYTGDLLKKERKEDRKKVERLSDRDWEMRTTKTRIRDF